MSNGQVQLLTILLSAIGIIFIPMLVVLVRGIVKWTRVEDKLDEVIRDMKELVLDKNKVHLEITTQMREDRSATDKRLRWLEEYLWSRGKPNAL